MDNRKLKNIKCLTEKCDTSLRLCSKGLICQKNHIILKNTEQYLDYEALLTGVNRPTCIECELLLSKCICEIATGFMLKNVNGRL
jgi:hypothetical protein